jgi:bifunctional DNA-binding transcriptional regulator/antitoxin component of YhaV-PrlF toxin-antitoxin module
MLLKILSMPGEERLMKEMHSTVTTKGQVTIPVEIRRLLKVKPMIALPLVARGGIETFSIARNRAGNSKG